MRELFTRIEDDMVMGIETDMSAYGYSSNNPWLLSIFIKFDAQNEKEESFEEFLEIKESLVIALEHKEKAKYVGSRMLDGWSELYFYAQGTKELELTVANILKSTKYVYESSIVKDTKWDFHYKNLTPSELELSHIESEKIIFMLEEEDDNLNVVRDVEHYISFDTPTQKNKFINSLDLEGFSFKDEISSEEFENGIALVKKHNVTREVVKEEVEKLFSEIKKFHGFYEGWSTTLSSEIDEE